MTSEIQILSDRVANQIAAGEVIERPVAVVKELVENSIDAGSARVEVEFRDGGKSYIRVEDNGAGMSPPQALLSLERHATSKIRTADDLLHVCSLGFRGEALPSIASVSRFTLRSRTVGSSTGTEISVNGGRLQHQRECGMAQGTCVIVEHLFNSVPARRKFLKKDNTEAAHIIHLMRLLALSHPSVAFRLIENGREVFRSPVCKTLKERIGEIWGQDFTRDLIELPRHEAEGLVLYGLIGKPGSLSATRATRSEIITLVNHRAVDNRTLMYAILESYHGYIPRGRYPAAYLFLEISPDAVDVNVHPAKREVRFREEGKVRRFVMQNILNALESTTKASFTVEKLTERYPTKDNIEVRQTVASAEQGKIESTGASAKKAEDTSRAKICFGKNQDSEKRGQLISTSDINMADNERESPNFTVNPIPEPKIRNLHRQEEIEETKESDLEVFADWNFLGFIFGKFTLWESPQGLVVLNPIAARERILYEKLQRDFDSESEVSQALLIPVPAEFDAMQVTLLSSLLPLLGKIGFVIEEFGRNFYRIESIPSWLEPADSELFLRDVISSFLEKGVNPTKFDLIKEQLAKAGAAWSVKSERITDPIALKKMLKDLLECRFPLICPRGRPTYIEYARADLERKFSS